MEDLYNQTMKKKAILEGLGYNYRCIWEHEFHEEIKTNQACKDFIQGVDVSPRLSARDSFYGGRTNCSWMYYKCQDGEKILYVDFTSLYPYINVYARYPVGHPEIITSNFLPLDQYFGIAKVTVNPPRHLYHPVLPYRSNGKLKFPLCRTCADNENQGPCSCSDEDRAITATWCLPEIEKAVEKGYKVTKVFEVYHWPETALYDQAEGTEGLFTQYIQTFLRFKQQASDWPEWCKTDQDKQAYITAYAEREGVHLDWNMIEKNPGLRALAKLCLNR
jgi:hypothetical protein